MNRTISIRRPLYGAALLLPLLMVLGCGKPAKVTGTWEGTLDYSSVEGAPPGKTSRMVVNIRSEGDHLTASLSTPDEGPQVVPADSVEFKNDVITMNVSKRLAIITANLNSNGDELQGNFKQEPYNLPFTLKKATGF
jgi:hypothetical protein